MAKLTRNIGIQVYDIMCEQGMSCEEFAKQMGYSLRDAHRITEGRILISPHELSHIAEILHTSKKDILDHKMDCSFPELQYMKEFGESEHLDQVMDLMDDYITLKESVSV